MLYGVVTFPTAVVLLTVMPNAAPLMTPPRTKLPPFVMLKKREAVMAIGKLTVSVPTALSVMLPARLIAFPENVKAPAPELNVRALKAVLAAMLLFKAPPALPAAPKISESPPMGGLLALPLVQLAPVAQ